MTNRSLLITVAFLCTATTACAPLGRGVQKIGTKVHEESIAMDHKVRDMFDSEDIYGRERNLPAATHAYCYKTLAQVSCYGQPVPGQELRLVGYQQPEPTFAEYVPVPEPKPETLYVNAAVVAPAPVVAAADRITVYDIAPDGQTYNSAPPAEPEIPDYRKPRELIPVFE